LAALFLCGCNSVFYQGDSRKWWPPEARGYDCERKPLRMSDGIELETLYCLGQAPSVGKKKQLIIQFHGNAQNINAHYLQLIWLTRYGYDFAGYDYRGYGNSGGVSNQHDIRKDAQAYIRFIRGAYSKHQRIFFGQSLGGAVLMQGLIDEGMREDEIYVFEGTFSSYQRIGRQFLADRFLFWPFQWLPYLLLSDAAAPDGGLHRFRHYRVLIIHGEDDPVIPLKHGQIIAAQMGKPLWIIPQGGHLGLWRNHEGERAQQLIDRLSTLQDG
jgi:pimeloyl-ACP methyl ester carboxylesterase